ncbi:MAG: zinc-binding dehydrogenase [Actinomycetota bacterium]|nr:zinc-binding dehydrogenase [Actinomycetota bacterium]
MRALMLEDFGRLVVVDVPEPVAAPGDVVIETVATGVCGSDIHGYTGDNGRRVPGQIMGHETVGRIHAIGDGVDAAAYPLGAVVTVNPVILTAEGRSQFAGREQHDPQRSVLGVDPARNAAFAHRFVVPSQNVVVLPESMPIAYGALIEPLAVALNGVRRAGLKPGDAALVVGGGPIGQSTVLAAFHQGASVVYVSELNQSRRELCERLGAIAIDPRTAPVRDQVVERHGGLVDVAIDAVGIDESLEAALNSTVFGGVVSLVGMGTPRLNLDAYRVSTEERSIVGSFTYSFQVFEDAARWVAEGDDALAQLISAEVSLDDADALFQRLATTADIPAKALVRFDR